jgi:hypothetical protein
VSAHFLLFDESKMTSEDDEKVVKAANLFRLVPASSTSFLYADALVHVGVASDVARTETYRTKFNYQTDCILQQDGPPRFDNSDFGKAKRAKDIMHLLPELRKADLCKLAGWMNQDLYVPLPQKGPSKLCMQVQEPRPNSTRKDATIQLRRPIPPIEWLQLDLLQLDLLQLKPHPS